MGNDQHHISGFKVSRRRLPHHEDLGATYFLCLCLKRPPVVDLVLPEVAHTIVAALRYFDGQRYLLFDYCVMPDHVHMLVKPIVANGKAESIKHIMRCLKGWTARRINEALGREGEVWQDDTYDHLVRNEDDFHEKAAYIFDNPHRAGLVDDPAKWPWWGQGSGLSS